MPTFIKLVDPMPLEVTGMVVYDGTVRVRPVPVKVPAERTLHGVYTVLVA